MSLMDKIKFWKKDPLADLPELDQSFDPQPSPNLGLQSGSVANHPLGDPMLDANMPPPQAPRLDEQPQIISESPGITRGSTPQQIHTDSHEKSLEIISMKLDNLKVALENISQRLANIERLATDSEPKRPNW